MEAQGISAVTIAVSDMTLACRFYDRLGLEITYGGPDSPFTSLRLGDQHLNLIQVGGYQPHWWGRTILRVESADAWHRRLAAAGLDPEVPRNGPWGERYFHVTDPDGHELSFAELLPS